MGLTTTPLVDSIGNEIYKGATYIRNYQWLDGTTPVDLTGATGVCRINRGSTLLFSPVVNIVDAVNGKFRITASNTMTATATPVIPATSMAISRIDFEGNEKYEVLNMFIYITLSGIVYPVVKGFPRFFDSPNL